MATKMLRMPFFCTFLLLAALPATGKKVDELMKRMELMEAKMESLEASVTTVQTVQPTEGTEVFLTKAEVHERFQLYHAAQTKELRHLQEQLNGFRSEMRKLQELLLQKADANQVLTAAEIHERFRVFHAAQKQAEKSTPCIRCEVPGDIMSRAEMHESLRLFQDALPLNVTGPNDCTDCTPTADLQATVPLAESSWIAWIFHVLAVGAGIVLGLMGLCVALGESKALEDRLVTLEERFEDSKFISTTASAASPGRQRLPLRSKLLSGAAGAAVGTTTGAISGSFAGGTLGAVAGLVPAIFTFGLSIPLGAAMGSGLGLVTGSVVGGGTGAFGGVQAATWYKGRASDMRC